MAHTLPPWTSKWVKDTIDVNVDLGELAVRLGSLISVDRRGDIIWSDDFQYGLQKWTISGDGLGNTQTHSTEQYLSKGAALKLILGSNGTWYGGLVTTLPAPAAGKIGFETSFSIDSDFDYLYIDIYTYLSGRKYRARLKVDYTNTKIQLQDSALDWQDILTSAPFSAGSGYFHKCKFVFDTDALEYTRFLWHNTEVDLSAYGLNNTSTALPDRIAILIQCYGDDGTNSEVFIDNIIVTQNEP